MKRTKLLLVLCVMALTAVVFTGCKNEPGGDGGKVKVTGVTITAPGGGTSTDLWMGEGAGTVANPNSVELIAAVTPGNASNKSVTWSVFPQTTTNHVIDGNKITLTPKAVVGTTATTVTAKSKDGNFTKSHTIYVKNMGDSSEPGPIGDAALVLFSQPNAAGTTDIAAAWDNTTKKYTISNTSDAGGFFNNTGTSNPPNISVQGATFVHLNKTITGTASISARIKLTARSGSGGGTAGIVIGMFDNPATAGNQNKFAGIRVTSNSSEMRGYCSRPAGDNSATPFAPAFTPAAWNEEFILEVARTGTDYLFSIKNSSDILITTLTRNATQVTEINPAYLGFIVARADVEISQITIKNDTTTVFSTPATAGAVTPPESVEFTAPVSGTGPYSYNHSISGGHNTLQISAKVLPANAVPDITWSITGAGASLDPLTGGTVTATLTQAGEVTVTATAFGTEVKAVLALTVSSDPIPVVGVVVSAAGAKTDIMAGDGGDNHPHTLQMNALVSPGNATYDSIVWSVSDTSTYSAATTATGGSINASGLLTAAANQTAETVPIYVFASTTNPAFNSTGYQITVTKYKEPELKLARIVRGTTGTTNFANGELTITGNGVLSTSVHAYHLVYVTKPARGDFYDAEVDILLSKSSITAANNNSKIGLIAIKGDPATQTAASLQYWMIAHLNTLTSVPQRMRKTSTGGNNNGSGSGLTAPTASTLVETLGLKRNSATVCTFTQKLDSGSQVSTSDDNAIFSDADDVYIGLLVSSNTAASPSTMVISALRIKFPGDVNYTVIDLSQTIQQITAP